MLIGYSRVSTDDQNLDLQRDALTASGCECIIVRAEQLREQGIGLKSLHESIDTGSSGGKLIFHMFGALAEFERNLVRERTQAGLEAARARGRKGGRKKLLDAKKRAHAVDLYKSKKHSIREICQLMEISRQTLYTYVEEFSDGP